MQPFVSGPAAGWVSRPADDAEDDEPFSRRLLHKMSLIQREKALTKILGSCVVGTTVLPRPVGGSIGPAKDRDGRVLRWSLWSPARNVLIDIFRRRIPAMEEMEDRKAFAAAHGLRYGIVEPGRRLSLEMLEEWINGR